MEKRKGQVLVGVILLLAVLAIVVPLMVEYIRNEANWSMKQGQNNNAFQLAEAAVDRGYQKVSESTTTWTIVKNGGQLAGFKFDTAYADLSGGSYTISITSGPDTGQCTVIGIGRDRMKKETRALKAVYVNAGMSSAAIRAQGAVNLSNGGMHVEWGAIISPNAISTNSATNLHPQLWSASNITGDSNGPTPPNCDSPNCWQWHSYNSGIPPSPDIDIKGYELSAIGTGTKFSGKTDWTGGHPGDVCSGSCDTGDVYYVDGNLTVSHPMYVRGALVVMGNLTIGNGNVAAGSPQVPLPKRAWQQYANDWSHYTSGSACNTTWTDNTYAAFPGLYSGYNASRTVTVANAVVNGFTYVKGDLNVNGGAGQTSFVGALYVLGNVNLPANNACVFYTDDAGSNILTTKIVLSRQSWQDVVLPWPLP